jgi:hypothetical protein
LGAFLKKDTCILNLILPPENSLTLLKIEFRQTKIFSLDEQILKRDKEKKSRRKVKIDHSFLFRSLNIPPSAEPYHFDHHLLLMPELDQEPNMYA